VTQEPNNIPEDPEELRRRFQKVPEYPVKALALAFWAGTPELAKR
jgi:hypothetical protein